MKITGLILVLLGLGGGGVYYWYHRSAGSGVTFRTAEVTVGDMIPTISATGTVEPLDSIDVGAQVAGQILTFGNDVNGKPVDYRSPVEKDMVLANIDPELYNDDLKSAQATLDAANAMLASAEANVLQYDAQFTKADSDWKRAQKVGPGEAMSTNDYETARAAFGVAKANVKLGDALRGQAKAMVHQDEALLYKAKKNVEYCTIKSPVKGVIIDRRVNVGQTVVSSLNTPSLFLIAKDLTQIQVWVSVNEADIDKVHPGQDVTFTVDAFPNETFIGKVGRVRLNAQMTQNVVTYTVEVNTENADSRLFPYFTANVQFEIAKHKDALLVPNGALRWFPQPEMVAPDVRKAVAEKSKAGPDPADAPPKPKTDKRHPGAQPSTHPGITAPHGRGTLWITDGKFVRPVKVKTGYTDGVNTEITGFVEKGTDVPAGAQVVVGEVHTQAADSGTTNPFAPQSVWGRKR
jgi:HlyD family secretion protein